MSSTQITIEPNKRGFNIVGQDVKSLIQVKAAIERHTGGFAIVDQDKVATKIFNVLKGQRIKPQVKCKGYTVRVVWLEVLRLAYIEELEDKYIAEEIEIGKRTVTNYWSEIRDILCVYEDDRKNKRVQTFNKARMEGLL